MIVKIRKLLIEHKIISIITLALLILKILYLIKLGFSYSLNSDDASYIMSGITFLETGKITLLGTLTAQIMPGMTFLIAFMALIFGKGILLLASLKILWIILGTISVIYFYKTVLLITKSKNISAFCSFFFLAFDYAWMDNLILTETPFLFLTILMFYFSIKYSITKNNKDFYIIIFYYILALMFRPTIGLFPIFLLIYLFLKGHNITNLSKKAIISFIILISVLTPWTIRNYINFNSFIPLTYGSGNPLLRGTYQGIGYPKDEMINYEQEVDAKLSPIMIKNLSLELSDPNYYLQKYNLLKYEEIKAKYRMSLWWDENPKSMIISYLYHKPKIMIHSTFYWDNVFPYHEFIIQQFRRVETLLFISSIGIILYKRKYLKEFIFIAATYFYQIALHSYTFAIGRYAQTLYFYKYLIIALGLKIIFDIYIKGVEKNGKVINNSSCI